MGIRRVVCAPLLPSRASGVVGVSGLIAAVVLAVGCGADAPAADAPLSTYAVIPRPLTVTDAAGGIDIRELTTLSLGNADGSGAAIEASLDSTFLGSLSLATGSYPPDPAVRLTQEGRLGGEAYRIDVAANGITLAAGTPAGHFYALQTLKQLWREALRRHGGILALGTIADEPRFGYRGVMLDVARHFHGPQEVRRVVDLLSLYKLNRLHLHLSDDQGWRIEIPAYPKLTEVGGSTQVGGGGGGFYTTEDYEGLVAYAAARHVTIVPEVDMPGHTNAALASYPELNCDGEARELYEGTEVGFSTLCIGEPAVAEFVRAVIDELAEITPGPYLHIGGDESWATDSLDYRRFVAEVQPMVRAAGKRMVGWDEIVTADIDSTAVVQLWHSKENAAAAAARGHDLILSPAEFAYLDMQYDSTSRIGLHWAGYIEVDDGYTWNPAAVLGDVPESAVLGIEAPLWTETVAERADVDYLMFPRALGYAEVGWSAEGRRDWADYRERLGAHGAVLDALGVQYYRSPRVEWDGEVADVP